MASFCVCACVLSQTISFHLLQVLKMNQHGDSWVEEAPYQPTGFNICSQISKEVQKEESEESVGTPTPPTSPEMPSNNDDNKQPVSSKKEIESDDETEKEPVKVTKHVVINLPEPEEEDKEPEEGKEQGKETIMRRDRSGQSALRRPVRSQRSQTIHFDSPPTTAKNKDFRRQSMVMLRKGHTGEIGSRKFRAALHKDSVYEVHPGWESIKRLSKVVG